MSATSTPEHWDVVIVGSGFGGSVSALRLREKGYRVLVVESGRRFADHELPKTSWRLPRFLWAPSVGMFGIQRITPLNDVLVMSGAGVGGGSLVYGNTLYEPLDDFYEDPQWRHITKWRDELAPHYEQAKRMLGVVENPVDTAADRVMLEVAEDLGVADTFHRTQVGILFGERPGEEVPDPFFGGAGPTRTTCTSCGACMSGCRFGAKNTLPKNYLHLAEALGAQILPLTTVTAITPRAAGGGYRVDMRPAGPGAGGPKRQPVTADHVILAAGTLGTQRLLHRMKADGVLPNLSDRLGELTRTNSESILTVEARDLEVDYSVGPAITSSIHPTPQTHVEPVRYGRGSNFMGLLSGMLTEGDRPGEPPVPRWRRFVAAARRDPGSFLRSLSVRRWSERTTVLLVMQSVDNSLDVNLKRGLLGRRLASQQGTGTPNPTWIPEAHEVAHRFAERTGGEARGTVNELFNVPMTAHILGGCPIGEDAAHGVLDAWQRVHGHPGLHVMDGAAVTANLGVNPSLTITAQAERAMSFWPNKGQADPRPELGADYTPVEPVRPHRPAVPDGAPAMLQW